MANIRKTFNFREGVKVDDSVLVVAGQRVGIGSTIPSKVLDINGDAISSLSPSSWAIASVVASRNGTANATTQAKLHNTRRVNALQEKGQMPYKSESFAW